MKRPFEDWMKLVDAYLMQRIGLSHMDLPDCDYWNWWNDGVTPKSAAARAHRNAGEG